ncbi:MAG TPA: phosphatase PAP2 family protein, partial [Streptosporangiaceae bacterium]|nr:phosphatase PAP2 family protein [Streptosporangiaceae bacterium]
ISLPRIRKRASLLPLILVTAAAVVFTVLLVLVRLRWAPLERVDHGAADRLNNLVAGHSAALTVISDVTTAGSTLVLSVVIAAAALLLALRRRWRLAGYLVATWAGALVLDPVLKVLVGRLRPVVAHPVAHAPGNSFPSGHSLGSIVCYGALFLVFLPVARGRWRTWFAIVTAALVAAIGISRILLGVHYVSDVAGGWAIGIAWLGLTTFAFELTRRAAGQPASHPVAEGLEPEARADLRPAQPEQTQREQTQPEQTQPVNARPRVARTAAGLLVAWVLILGAIVGIGELVTRAGNGNVLGDRTVPRWLAAHRAAGLTTWSFVFTTLGGTIAILAVAAVSCLVFLGITRRWRPVAFVVTLMLGELAMFLAAAAVVRRPRPPVSHLDHHLPTSAYPSGHEAATCCLYVGLAILVIGHARGWWRWLFLLPAVAFPVLVAASGMYRGEHHLTDVLASILFAALWVPAATLLIRPNSRAGGGPPHSTSSDRASMLAARSAAVAGRAA